MFACALSSLAQRPVLRRTCVVQTILVKESVPVEFSAAQVITLIRKRICSVNQYDDPTVEVCMESKILRVLVVSHLIS